MRHPVTTYRQENTSILWDGHLTYELRWLTPCWNSWVSYLNLATNSSFLQMWTLRDTGNNENVIGFLAPSFSPFNMLSTCERRGLRSVRMAYQIMNRFYVLGFQFLHQMGRITLVLEGLISNEWAQHVAWNPSHEGYSEPLPIASICEDLIFVPQTATRIPNLSSCQDPLK